jgi:hemerythrin
MEPIAVADSAPRPPIEWRESFRMDIPSIDGEHRSLFLLVRALDIRTVHETIERLSHYVISHFSNEEALMEGSRYPDLEEHRIQHRHLANLVGRFQQNRHEWFPPRVEELRRFLDHWLQSHILIHDLAFGQWYAGTLELQAGSPPSAGSGPTRTPACS